MVILKISIEIQKYTRSYQRIIGMIMQPYARGASIKLVMMEAEIAVALLSLIIRRRKLKTRGLRLHLCMKKQRETETSQVILTLMVKRRVPPIGDILPLSVRRRKIKRERSAESLRNSHLLRGEVVEDPENLLWSVLCGSR